MVHNRAAATLLEAVVDALVDALLDPVEERLDEVALALASELLPRLDRGLQVALGDRAHARSMSDRRWASRRR